MKKNGRILNESDMTNEMKNIYALAARHVFSKVEIENANFKLAVNLIKEKRIQKVIFWNLNSQSPKNPSYLNSARPLRELNIAVLLIRLDIITRDGYRQ